MGEDAQIDEADEGYGLSPVLDGSERFDEPEGVICSIDGSYATLKQSRQRAQNELQPCFEATIDQQRTLRSAMSRESLLFQSGVVFDESRPIFANISRKSQLVVRQNGSTIHLPQPLDTPLKQEKSLVNRSKSYVRPSSAKRREISPIRVVSCDGSETIGMRNTEVYDPLRKISNETYGSRDPAFAAELEDQEKKLMNGLKAIMNFCEKQRRPLSKVSTTGTMVTAFTRSGSASSVSTGRDALTKEVQNLQEAFAGMNFANRAAAGRDCDETNADSFVMDDEIITIERPPTGSRGSSTVEQARLSSAHILADNAIRDADHCSKTLRSGFINRIAVKEKGTNTKGGEKMYIKHHIITHRVKNVPENHHRHHRRNSTSLTSANHKPNFQPFRLDNRPITLDVDSIPHLSGMIDTRDAMFDGAEVRAVIHGNDHAARHQRKIGGGKKGRPVIIGRGLYARGRMHFRPAISRHVTPRGAEEKLAAEHKEVPEYRDVATYTAEHEDHAVQTEVDLAAADFAAKAEVETDDEEDEVIDSIRESVKRSHHKHHKVPKKIPFVGSGQKGDSTFSIAGNQQQVMKIIGTRFQEWLPLVRSIIYDAHCKDYAKALQRDLARQKRSHAEQLRLLESDLEGCRNDLERREVRADIVRLKQQWTAKHDRVLTRLTEQISKGGVWSKVQQLRTIYAALLA